MANSLLDNSYDVFAWNYRGCGNQMNRQARLYHSGATDDLEIIVNKGISLNYKKIVLIGFSLGGNLTLKYVGEKGQALPSLIKGAIAFSTPLDLDAGCRQLAKRENFLYTYRFLSKLKKKARKKHAQFPDLIDPTGLDKIRDLRSFADRYTAPLHGFLNAADYYKKCSAIRFIDKINIPTLILNAKNDPFLPEECYPTQKLANLHKVTFEVPEHGGHVGFMQRNHNGAYWSELRALEFIENDIL